MPKRTFIANINTANEEIVRLDTELTAYEQAKTDLLKAQGDLEAAQNLLAEAPKAEDLLKAQTDLKAAQDALALAPKAADLQALKDSEKKAKDELAALVEKHDTMAKQVKDLALKADGAMRRSLEAAAAAGVVAVVDAKVDPLGEHKASSGKTGLARAIAANIELSEAKAAR